MNVLLVHGIFDTGAIFWRLQQALTQEGHQCLAPALSPWDGRHGLADLASKLASFVDQWIDRDASLAIIGFSMGCLVSRYYLQRLEGFRRTRAFLAISGPHQGTATAYLYPGQGTRDMRPGSPFLRDLEWSSNCLKDMALFAYWTPLDLMIVPSTSCRWHLATEIKIWSPLHRLMPNNRRLCSDIAGRLAAIEGRLAHKAFNRIAE